MTTPREQFDLNINLAHKMTNNYLRRTRAYYAADDIHQAALVGLWRACINYDPAKNDSFRAYAIFRIRAELLDDARRATGRSKQAGFELRQCSFTKLLHRADDDEPAQRAGVDPSLAVATKDETEVILASLPERTQRIFRAHFMDGLNFRELAPQFGIQSSRAHQIVTETIKKLRSARKE